MATVIAKFSPLLEHPLPEPEGSLIVIRGKSMSPLAFDVQVRKVDGWYYRICEVNDCFDVEVVKSLGYVEYTVLVDARVKEVDFTPRELTRVVERLPKNYTHYLYNNTIVYEETRHTMDPPMHTRMVYSIETDSLIKDASRECCYVDQFLKTCRYIVHDLLCLK